MKKMTLALALLAASSLSSAALVSADWQTSGDALLTVDTTSGLEWLDLTQTYNQTVASVLPRTGAGQTFDGFRLALAGEVHALMAAAGLPVSTTTSTVSTAAADLAAADALTLLLGETVGQHFGSTFRGARGHLTDGSQDRVVGYYTVSNSSLFNDYFSGFPAWQGAGVWLVRTGSGGNVPEPGALSLVAVALAGLALSRRRAQA